MGSSIKSALNTDVTKKREEKKLLDIFKTQPKSLYYFYFGEYFHININIISTEKTYF